MTVFIIIGILIGGYLLGSIPSAVWIGKQFYRVDVREHGSRNAGSTNVLRVLGRRAAAPVFVIDAGKGYAAVMLSHLAPLDQTSEGFVFLKFGLIAAVILGHIFPLFAGFRGGKGVATIAGSVLALSPLALLMSFSTFLIILLIWHYVSLGSIMAGILYPVYMLISGQRSITMIGFGILVAAMLIFTHRNNIKRLWNHSESKTYLFKRK